MKSRTLFTLAGFSILALSSVPAEACSVCGSAAADWILPPVKGWALLSASWFLALAAIRSWQGLSDSGIPGLRKAASIVAVVFALGVMFFGLGLVGLLLAPCLWFSLRSWVRKPQEWNPSGIVWLRTVSVAGVALLIGLSAFSVALRQQRTEPQFAADWPGSALSRSMVERWVKQLPESEDELVAWVEDCPPEWNVSRAIEDIEKQGQTPLASQLQRRHLECQGSSDHPRAMRSRTRD